MKNSIVGKLNALLAGGVDSEGKVVYLLAESRKLFPEYKPDTSTFALKLYSNWALHVDLSVPKTTGEFLGLVDKFTESFLNGNKDIVLEHRMFEDFVYLETFRQQFKTFLRKFGLPTTICDSDNCWHVFLKYYSGVIEDGSLTCQGVDMKLIDKLIFRRGKETNRDTHMPFDLSWDIFLLAEVSENKILTVDVNTAPLPNGKHKLIFGAKLHS